MKKQFFKTSAIKVYSTALLTSVLLLSGFNPAKATEKTSSVTKAPITFVGSAENVVTFNINYENQTEGTFVVELSDDRGEVLYAKKFNDKVLNKNIFVRNEGYDCKITFKIRAGKNTFSQEFNIKPQTTILQEMVVTRL